MPGIKRKVVDLLESVDIKINGDRPWDIQVHNENLFQRVLQEGSLGLGEAYMDSWWDCQALDTFFIRILEADLNNEIKVVLPVVWEYVKSLFWDKQSKKRAFKVGEQHYDIGNDLYKAMLDDRMVYTCGFWEGAENLDEAQENKLKRVCQRLYLQSRHRVLDIG